MELRGIRYDTAEAKKRLATVNHIIQEFQADLDAIAGVGIDPKKPRTDLLAQVRAIMGYKKDSTKPLKAFEWCYDRVIHVLLGDGPLTKAEVGFINIACKL